MSVFCRSPLCGGTQYDGSIIVLIDKFDDNRLKLATGTTFFACGEDEASDGIRCDVGGNLWCAYGAVKEGMDGVLVVLPQGKRIGRIALPERAAEPCFSGREDHGRPHGRRSPLTATLEPSFR